MDGAVLKESPSSEDGKVLREISSDGSDEPVTVDDSSYSQVS